MRSHQFLFQAIAQLRDVIEITPDCAPAHNNLAWLLATSADLELRQPPEAIAHALKAIELAPQARGPLNTLGVAQYRAGHWQAAIESLQKSMHTFLT